MPPIHDDPVGKGNLGMMLSVTLTSFDGSVSVEDRDEDVVRTKLPALFHPRPRCNRLGNPG